MSRQPNMEDWNLFRTLVDMIQKIGNAANPIIADLDDEVEDDTLRVNLAIVASSLAAARAATRLPQNAENCEAFIDLCLNFAETLEALEPDEVPEGIEIH